MYQVPVYLKHASNRLEATENSLFCDRYTAFMMSARGSTGMPMHGDTALMFSTI